MNVLEKLNVYGWNNVEPIIMASLASEDPLLLIGKHGAAKSKLLETLSKSLNMEFRNYNASLIDYDDLVGIPIPSDDKKSLNFISNNSSIWNAEVVFMDEINRCKPELQNKLFPLIYDKRIQGTDLDKLKYRWAAMNPPFDEDEGESYLGAFPLDAALMDRFSYIVHVPTWDDLSDNDKVKMLNLEETLDDDIHLNDIIELIREEYKVQANTYSSFLDKFLIRLMDLLREKFGYISARRAKIIKRDILYVHASRIVLSESDKVKFEDSAYLTLTNALPLNEKYNEGEIYLLTKNAYKEFRLNKETQEFLRIKDNKKKLIYGVNHLDKVDVNTFYENIPTTLNEMSVDDARVLGLCLYLKLKSNTDIPTFVYEQIFRLCRFDGVNYLNPTRFKNIDTKLPNASDEVKLLLNLVTLNNNQLTPANTIKLFQEISKEMKL